MSALPTPKLHFYIVRRRHNASNNNLDVHSEERKFLQGKIVYIYHVYANSRIITPSVFSPPGAIHNKLKPVLTVERPDSVPVVIIRVLGTTFLYHALMTNQYSLPKENNNKFVATF